MPDPRLVYHLSFPFQSQQRMIIEMGNSPKKRKFIHGSTGVAEGWLPAFNRDSWVWHSFWVWGHPEGRSARNAQVYGKGLSPGHVMESQMQLADRARRFQCGGLNLLLSRLAAA
jgi:hypothetical protein